MATTIRTRIYMREDVSFVKFLFLPSWFAKLLEVIFSCFAKIRWMLSWFAKLLELLLTSQLGNVYCSNLTDGSNHVIPNSNEL
jgi:hypothetical protein